MKVHTTQELVKALRCNLFAKRDTLDEAMDYAMTVLKNDPAAVTALMVVLNTVADSIETAEVLNELGVR